MIFESFAVMISVQSRPISRRQLEDLQNEVEGIILNELWVIGEETFVLSTGPGINYDLV